MGITHYLCQSKLDALTYQKIIAFTLFLRHALYMRPLPTAAEVSSIDALLEVFRKAGHTANRIPRDVEDKPDALLQMAGAKIACECVQIPPEYILSLRQRRQNNYGPKDVDILWMTWPNEPHQWIAEAISRKNKRVVQYIESTAANHVWLLIHTPLQDKRYFVNTDKEWIEKALIHGAMMNAHSFEQVFFWSPDGGVKTIYSRRQHAGMHSDLALAFSKDGVQNSVPSPMA